MKTITLDTKMNYIEAVKYLIDGKCIGIRPEENTNYLVKYKPDYFSQKEKDYLLCWNGMEYENGTKETGVRTEQILGVWYPVIIDFSEFMFDDLKIKLT